MYYEILLLGANLSHNLIKIWRPYYDFSLLNGLYYTKLVVRTLVKIGKAIEIAVTIVLICN